MPRVWHCGCELHIPAELLGWMWLSIRSCETSQCLQLCRESRLHRGD